MDQQRTGPSLDELLAMMAAKNPDAETEEKPSPGRDTLAALIARVNRPGRTLRGPMSAGGIRG
jgi:hypothetical protein